MLEIFCHGNDRIVNKIISEFFHCNVRIAYPGEFSYRAFKNGKIDLMQAESIAENAPLAVAASKALIQAQQGITEEEFWELQKPHMMKVFTSNDAKEGPASFAEKRSPNWSGT